MRSERKKGRAFLARFMVLMMIINLLSGINPGDVRAENGSSNFDNNGKTVDGDGFTLTETASNYDKGKFDVEMLIQGGGNTIVTEDTMDVVLVIDRSKSMSENNKMTNTKEAAKRFVSSLLENKNVHVGLVSFGGRHRLSKRKDAMIESLPISTNAELLVNEIDRYDEYGKGWWKNIWEGSRKATFTQAGLKKARELLSESSFNAKRKAVILLTDGEPTYAYETIPNDNGKIDYDSVPEDKRSEFDYTHTVISYGRDADNNWDNNNKKPGVHREQYTTGKWKWKKTWTYHPCYVELVTNYNPWYIVGNGDKLTQDVEIATLAEAGRMKKQGIEIFSVGIGVSDTGRNILKKIASNRGNGYYYDSTISADDMNTILSKLKHVFKEYSIKDGVLKVEMNPQVDYKGELKIEGKNTSNSAKDEDNKDLADRVKNITKKWDANSKVLTLSNITLGKDEELRVKYRAELNEVWKDGNRYKISQTAELLPKGENEPSKAKEFDVPTVNEAIMISVSVTKKWNGDAPNDVNKVIANVYKGDEGDILDRIEITKWDNEFSSKELRKYESGKEITYRVDEEIPEGATYKKVKVEKSADNPNKFTIINESLKTYSFTVQKNWVYTAPSLRQDVKVQLYYQNADGEKVTVGDAVTIKKDDGKYEYTGLVQPGNGKYFVKELDKKETPVDNGGVVELDNASFNVSYADSFTFAGTVITNTNNANNKFKVKVNKIWKGTPKATTFKLMKDNDKDPIATLELKVGNTSGEFEKDVDIYNQDGSTISYRVHEDVPEGYDAVENDIAVTSTEPAASFTNVDLDKKISFTLKKVWQGGNADKAIFTFTNSDANATAKTITEEVTNTPTGWTKTVTLPRYNKDGSDATYTVTEKPIPGFTSELSKDKVDKNTQELTATNTLKSNETVDIDIEKIWKGNIPEGAKRSVEVEVQKKNEKDEWVKFKSYTLTPETSWEKSDKLPKYNNDGKAVEYRTVETAINGEEITVPDEIDNGYKHSVFNIKIDNGSVTNTFEDIKQPKESDKRNIRVVKTWVNAKDNQKKPVRVTLYKIVADENGNSTLEKVDELPLNSDNNWIGEFKNVDRYVGMEATETPANPTTTNGQETPATEIQTPANPAEGNGEAIMPTTPAPVTENGTTEERPVVEPTPAAPAVSNEPIARANKNANKVKAMAMAPTVKYVVIETEIDGKGFENTTPDEYTNDYELNGYKVSIESDLDKGCNTVFVFNEPKGQEEPHFAKVIATKVWADSARGKEKPVVFTLYCDMDNKWVATGKTVTLPRENNNWTAIFDNLPEKDEHGESILYYVFETQIGDTVIENLPNALSENVTYTTDTIDGGKYTVNITVEGNDDKDSADIIDKVTITNSYTANPNPGGGGNPGGGTGSGDNPGGSNPGSNPGTEPVVPVQDPTPDTTPTVDVPDDTTPQGDANINPDTDNDDEDTDDADDDDVLEVDNDDVPQGTAKTKDDAVKEDPIDVDGDPTPRGNANLPKTGGTTADFLSIIGLGLVGLGLVIKRRK